MADVSITSLTTASGFGGTEVAPMVQSGTTKKTPLRTITGPAAGITVTNGDGVSGNPTLALANDLAALEGLSSTGMIARTATDTATTRTITGTANEITVTNGNGVSGNPTLSLPTALTFTGKTVTGGIYTAEDGTSSAVAFGFSGAPNLGFYRNSTSMRIAAAGTNMFDVNSTRITLGSVAGAESLRVTRVSSAVNYINASGAVTTANPSFTADGSDTNVGIRFISKGTGEFTFLQSGLRTFTVRDATGAAANSVIIDNGATGNAPSIGVIGETNVDLILNALGTGVVRFGTSGSFAANGSVAVTLTSVGPTGASTTVQEWLKIKNAGGTTRYIPCY